jgi:hypothetical protein
MGARGLAAAGASHFGAFPFAGGCAELFASLGFVGGLLAGLRAEASPGENPPFLEIAAPVPRPMVNLPFALDIRAI